MPEYDIPASLDKLLSTSWDEVRLSESLHLTF